MLKKLLFVLLIITQLLICSPVHGARHSSTAPRTKAKAYILINARNSATLAQRNANQKLAPASLTKLMTLYITYKHLQDGSIHLKDKVLVSKKAWKTGGARMFIQAGTKVTVDDLIHGSAIDSGNDACVALAEHIAGSEKDFVAMMNQEAKALGMMNTHFMNSNGLPAKNHYSSARDLSLLSQALIRNFPKQYNLFSQKWFTYNNIRQHNRNRLLWSYPSADGLKTGYTPKAGYCLASSAKKNNVRLISVILGEPTISNRTNDAMALFNYGFRLTRKS